jgi:hypothetical protein
MVDNPVEDPQVSDENVVLFAAVLPSIVTS